MTTKSTRLRIHFAIRTTLTCFAAFLIGGCASMTKAPSAPPAATVRIQLKSVAYYGSATTGNGILNYRGQQRNFQISSLGVGGTGGQKISATGKVYNLEKLSDFPGKYRGVSSGFTLLEGKMHARLTNGNGVVIYLAGVTEGLATSGGVQTFDIALTN